MLIALSKNIEGVGPYTLKLGGHLKLTFDYRVDVKWRDRGLSEIVTMLNILSYIFLDYNCFD